MSTVTKPILLDETGKRIAQAIEALEAIGRPTQEQTGIAVSEWLDDHPEATTTVQDGSLTEQKLANSLKLKAIKDYTTPEMFGAVGDGDTDDTTAFRAAVANSRALLLTKTYKLTDTIEPDNIIIMGTTNSKIIYTGNVNLFHPSGKVVFDHINAESTYDGDISQSGGWSFCMCNYNNSYQAVEAYNCNINDFPGGFTQIGDNSVIMNNIIILREVVSSALNTFYGIHGDFKNCMTIEGNTIKNGRHGIYVSGGCKDIVIRNNYLSDVTHGAIHIYSIVETRRADNCIIEGNIIKQETSPCIVITGYANNLKVTGNLFTCTGSYGVQIEGQSNQSSLNISVDNNKIIALTGMWVRTAKDCYITNNVMQCERNAFFIETNSNHISILNNTVLCSEMQEDATSFVFFANTNNINFIDNKIIDMPDRLYIYDNTKTCGIRIENSSNVTVECIVNGYNVVSVLGGDGVTNVILKSGKLIRANATIPSVYHNSGDTYFYQARDDALYAKCTTAGNPGTFTKYALPSVYT